MLEFLTCCAISSSDAKLSSEAASTGADSVLLSGERKARRGRAARSVRYSCSTV